MSSFIFFKYLSTNSLNKSSSPVPSSAEVLLYTAFISLANFLPSSSLTSSSKNLSSLFPINATILYSSPYSFKSGYHIVFKFSKDSLLVIS